MAAQWARIVNTTIRKYIREQEVNILRNRKLSALMKKRGRISFNWSGTSMDWKVKYKRIALTPFSDGDTLEFSRKNRWQTANLEWRGYAGTDSMTKGEFLQNRGTEAIVKSYSTIAEDLIADLEDSFGEEFYVDGTTAGNSKRMHGIESFMQQAGTAANGNGGLTPSGTYAGLSCVPGNYGGTWNPGSLTAWPNGKGDAQYDFWSPVIVDVGDTLFSATNTWAANCVEAISYGIIKSKKNKSKKGMLDLIFVSEEMYRKYLKNQRANERLVIEKGANSSDLVALGFTDVINQDGVDISWEYGTPVGVGYGFNVDMMELRSMQAQVFVPEGPSQDISTGSWRFRVDCYGNLVFNPKFFTKFLNTTNTSDAI